MAFHLLSNSFLQVIHQFHSLHKLLITPKNIISHFHNSFPIRQLSFLNLHHSSNLSLCCWKDKLHFILSSLPLSLQRRRKNQSGLRTKPKQDLFRRKQAQHFKLRQELRRILMYLKTQSLALGYKYSAPTGHFTKRCSVLLKERRKLPIIKSYE